MLKRITYLSLLFITLVALPHSDHAQSSGVDCLKVSCYGLGVQPPMTGTTLTANTIPKATGPATVGNSLLTDDGTTHKYTGTGGIDGKVPLAVTTATTGTLGTALQSGYTFNNVTGGTAGVTYTLPTAVTGLQYCITNDTGVTSVLTVATSASGQFIDVLGVLTASGGNVTSAGALGDASCFVAKSSTVWKQFQQNGTWTAH